MSLSILTPSRTILMISDEALYVYSISSKGVKMVEAVPWSVENFEDNVAVIISKECGGKPVLILNDMVEQHYRKEKIPNVGTMDKQNVLKRKLQVAFPNYPVRAALALKEKVAKTKQSAGGSLFIFAAVPATDAFAKTMSAAKKSLAPIAGFCLLPIESSDMIKKLSDKVTPKGEKKPKWTVFMGQHQSGGLRQIVIKDGQLALTRMTPIAENDDDPVSWSNEVYQEFQATMSYLSRFGFDPTDGLNVILISEPNTADMVNEMIDVPCGFYGMTADDASDHLNLKMGHQGIAYHADALHLSWIGKKSRFILPMKAKQIANVSQPRQIALLASVLLFLSAAFMGYQLLDYYQRFTEAKESVENTTRRTADLRLQYQKEVKVKEDRGFDIKLIQGSLGFYKTLEDRRIDLLPLLFNTGQALGNDLRIDRIDLKRGGQSNLQRLVNNNQASASPLFTAKIQLTFPSTTDAEKGNSEVQQLRTRLQKRLPDHVVRVSKLLEDYEYSEEIVVETGNGAVPITAQDYAAEITIEGPETND